MDKNKPIDIEKMENKNILDEFGIIEQIKFAKTANYSNSNQIQSSSENEDVHGLNEAYPVEEFIDFYSVQNNRKIKLQTYKYPAENNIKGIVYYVYF